MKMKELKKLENKDLNEKLAELRNKTRELRFSIANNQLKAVRQLRDVKKTIAKILTILNQKRIAKENSTAEEVEKNKVNSEAKEGGLGQKAKKEVAETKSSK